MIETCANKPEQDYISAINRIKELWGAKKDTPNGDELDLLVTLVESYEVLSIISSNFASPRSKIGAGIELEHSELNTDFINRH